ncbi:hypothetical protein IC614_02580 [Allosphingosinicella flava]|uniref:Uncharacterized protein n=1 Tax=Allosphingosinicella flava TaxID=2771430 RepID=A0A7T2LMQ3_9SPHN|nr:hypothetical protein [Sphingosinicella flava]QPQ55508.1 hypothetical protein IC614_02580 [Sphingosinicella flava]
MIFSLIAVSLLAPNQLTASPTEAREKMAAFGACVADRSADLAARTLNSDFTSATYRNTMKRLSESNRGCFKKGRMRASGLLFAGAIAERLIEQDGTPVNVQLARAAVGQAPATYSPSDKVAMCVVRSAPDQVGALFMTNVATAEEGAAASGLASVMTLCAQGGPAVQTTPEGLRAMLATAAFRSIAASAETSN